MRNFDRVEAETSGAESSHIEDEKMDSFEELEGHCIQVCLKSPVMVVRGDLHYP